MAVKSHPILVDHQNVSIPIYVTPTGPYVAYTVAWHFARRRQRKKFSDLDAAKAFARDRAEEIANGRASQHALTYDQAQEYKAAKDILGTGSLIEAARDFVRRHPIAAPSLTIKEVAAQLLAAKRAQKRRRPISPAYLANVEQRLGVIGQAFQCRLDQLTADGLQTWIDSLDVTGGRPSTLRTRNNYLADLRQLVAFAKLKRLLPADFDELDRVVLQRAGPGKIQPYTPEEAETILRHAQRHERRWLPYLPLRFFSGVRASEAGRLRPKHLHRTGWIALDGDITKTESRRLPPILPILKAWLRKYPPVDGRIQPLSNYHSASSEMVRVIKASGVTNRHNGLRDSYASYRMAMVLEAGKVAEETGHDIAQLRRSYREIRLPDDRVITPKLAERYFRISPVKL